MPPLTRPRYDVAIIGGGPAGSSLASLLARAGRRVALFERDSFPRDKLCGEFLSPEAVGALDELGCLDAVLAARPAAIRRARFFSPAGRPGTVELPGRALGLSRRVLDEILLRHARGSGARVWQRACVTRVDASPSSGGARLELELSREGAPPARRSLTAGLLVGAYGRREPLDKALRRRFALRDHPFAALQRHHRVPDSAEGRRLAAELDGCVELHLFDGGYCGLSFVEGGLVNVCMLLQKRLLDRLAPPLWEGALAGLSRSSAALRRRLAPLQPLGEAAHAVAQIPFEDKEPSCGGVLFVGDAAGMIAPLCGDGQAIALRSALALAEILEAPSDAPAGAAELWNERWRAQFSGPIRAGRLLQRALLRSAFAEVLVGAGRLFPRLGSGLFRLTRCADAAGSAR